MEIRERKEDEVTVVTLLGRLDEMATSQVESAFGKLIDGPGCRVLLDLSGVEYVSSSGLRVLLMLSKAMRKAGGHLKLCSLSPFVAEVFEVSNFLRLLPPDEQHIPA